MADVVCLDDERRRRAEHGDPADPACPVAALPVDFKACLPAAAGAIKVPSADNSEQCLAIPLLLTNEESSPLLGGRPDHLSVAPDPVAGRSMGLTAAGRGDPAHMLARNRATGPRTPGILRAWLGRLGGRSPRVDELALLLEQSADTTLLNRLNTLSTLEPQAQDIVQSVGNAARRTYQEGCDVVLQGDVITKPVFVVSGWAGRVKILPGGARQLVGFVLPGEGIGIRGGAEPVSITTIAALTTLETVDGLALLDPSRLPRDAGLSQAIARASLQDEEFFINQIVRLSLDSPSARLAHLVLELQCRLRRAGLATAHEFAMPITYDILAQAIGATPSAARRAMRALRRKNMVSFRRGRIVLSRPQMLQEMSGFIAPDTSP